MAPRTPRRRAQANYPSMELLRRGGRRALAGLGLGTLLASGCSAASADASSKVQAAAPDAGAKQPVKMGEMVAPEHAPPPPAASKAAPDPKSPPGPKTSEAGPPPRPMAGAPLPPNLPPPPKPEPEPKKP